MQNSNFVAKLRFRRPFVTATSMDTTAPTVDDDARHHPIIPTEPIFVTPVDDDDVHMKEDHWTTSPAYVAQVQPAALVIKMGFNRLFQYQPVTHYVFCMRCPITKTWWLVRKRYSDYVLLRKKLLAHHKTLVADPASCGTALAALLRPLVVDFKFPKKYLRDDDDAIKRERLHGLRQFAIMLMTLRLECMTLAVRPHLPSGLYLFYINTIYYDLTEFLDVPEPQVRQELHHLVAKVSPHKTPSPTTTSCCDDPSAVCAICLDEFRVADAVVELQCGHSYHKGCVGDWLREHCTCPLCRTVSFDEEFMIEYVAQVVLTKSKAQDLLYKLNQAPLLFDMFRKGSDARALPRALPLDAAARPASFHGRNLACTVCMEVLHDGHDTLLLECGHAFHRRCIYNWLGDHSTCPICRRLSHYGSLPSSSETAAPVDVITAATAA
ncbi:Aste57867_23301 [Aphanomyces stellatus]|uniref:Aste57867_23301 protein n=1 Tax=Aphanomyces stellatus TaxID=120398 RepID=A0A485LN65_9STRA|nr:hypothetical protein As57867_023230 [Aphanomyces stellatus]VFT99946.1 Aste57867_23301 [Aphanomyces stellatus]